MLALFLLIILGGLACLSLPSACAALSAAARWGALVGAVAASPASADGAPAPAIVLRYGQTSSTVRTIFSLPIFIAQREGLFAREGLDLRVTPIQGGTTHMIAALSRNEVDLTHVSFPFLVDAIAQGSDAAAILSEFDNPIYSLVAQPGIRSIADLRGRSIGMPAASDLVAIATRDLLRSGGLNDGAWRTIERVGSPDRRACLEAQLCDAVPLGQPDDFLASEKGFKILGITADATAPIEYTVTATRRSWAAAHADAVQRYVTAMANAFRFIQNPSNRPEVEKTIVETTDASVSIAHKIVDLYLSPDRGVWPKAGEFSEIGVRNALELMTKSGDPAPARVGPDQILDRTWLARVGPG